MKMKNSFLIFWFLLTATGATAGPLGHQSGSLVSIFDVGYLTSTKNFDDTGQVMALSRSNEFSQWRLRGQAEYDLSDQWGVFGAFSYKRANAFATTASRFNNNLSDFFLGTDVAVWNGWIRITPEVVISIPTYPKPGTEDSALLGDGASTISFALNGAKDWGAFGLNGYVGYRARSEGYSSSWLFGLQAQYMPEIPLFAFFGLYNDWSLNNDSYTSANRIAPAINYNGGSLIYSSINPSLNVIEAGAGFKISESFFITGSIETTIMGVRTAQYTQFLVGVGYTDRNLYSTNSREAAPDFTPLDSFEEKAPEKGAKKTFVPKAQKSIPSRFLPIRRFF